MVTRETDSTVEMFDSIVGLISSCTEGKVDATKLPMADLEYLFLQIRVKSVGESGKIPLVCRNTEAKCEEVHVEDVDLSLVNVDTSKFLDSQIKISDELMVDLVPPTCQLAFEMDGKSESEVIRPLLKSCMVRIYDEENTDIPLVEQMLKFWQFTEDEMKDSQPEIYWTDEEKYYGDAIIKEYVGSQEFGSLLVSDRFGAQKGEYDEETYKRI